jgi:hypothetical protein
VWDVHWPVAESLDRRRRDQFRCLGDNRSGT